jgi:hypothetical protein
MFFARQSSSYTVPVDRYENAVNYSERVAFNDLAHTLAQSSQKEYREGEYMCGHFSYDVMQSLETLNIKSRMMIGKKHENDNIHAWISIDIDPQTGQIETTKIDDTYELIDVCDIDPVTGALDCLAGNKINKDYYLTQMADSSVDNLPVE